MSLRQASAVRTWRKHQAALLSFPEPHDSSGLKLDCLESVEIRIVCYMVVRGTFEHMWMMCLRVTSRADTTVSCINALLDYHMLFMLQSPSCTGSISHWCIPFSFPDGTNSRLLMSSHLVMKQTCLVA